MIAMVEIDDTRQKITGFVVPSVWHQYEEVGTECQLLGTPRGAAMLLTAFERMRP
jgi:hypothetical protein